MCTIHRLNLYAEKSFGEYGDIGVSVTGTVDVMELDFSATNSPYAYDQTDIVTLLLLGKPSQELANSESQTSGALIQAGLFNGWCSWRCTVRICCRQCRLGSYGEYVPSWKKTLSDTMFLSYMMDTVRRKGRT